MLLKMTQKIFLFLTVILFFGCKDKTNTTPSEASAEVMNSLTFADPAFTLEEANKLVELPLHCVETNYPYKLGQVLESAEDLKEPAVLHPVFYGCFDWHSAVHGYWSMVTLLRQFPELEKAEEIKSILTNNLTEEKIAREVAYFEKKVNSSFERTYGWAWLLKLQEELYIWEDPMADSLAKNLQPLSDIIVMRYKEFLPKLVYPIRVGEHTNTAFGLTFAHDYAVSMGDEELKTLIEKRAKEFYLEDANCPISWEPSGYDFLSPCLEEVALMLRILSKDEFLPWMESFLPELKEDSYTLKVGEVSDRTDGKLVHLDGLNFSRAWSLYALAKKYPEYAHLKNNANEHVAYSYPNLVGDSYEGGHWLGSFAIYALNTLHNIE